MPPLFIVEDLETLEFTHENWAGSTRRVEIYFSNIEANIGTVIRNRYLIYPVEFTVSIHAPEVITLKEIPVLIKDVAEALHLI